MSATKLFTGNYGENRSTSNFTLRLPKADAEYFRGLARSQDKPFNEFVLEALRAHYSETRTSISQ